LQIATDLGEKKIQATVHKNLGAGYALWGEYNNALESLGMSSQLFEAAGDLEGASSAQKERQRLIDALKMGEARHIQVEPEASLGDLSEAIRNLERLLRVLANERDVSLIVSVPSSLPKLLINPRDLVRTLRDLLTNFIEVIPAGGTINVNAQLKVVDGKTGVELIVAEGELRIAGNIVEDASRIGKSVLDLSFAYSTAHRYGGNLKVIGKPGEHLTAIIWLRATAIESL